MDNSTILLLMHETAGVGWRTIERIVSVCPDLQEAVTFRQNEWIRLGISPDKAATIEQSLSRTDWMEKLENYHQAGIGFITALDNSYPERLKEAAEPPWVLYYKGNIALIGRPCIGMVGTRNPTVYGRKTAESLAAELSEKGACVVSGVARGIDAYAHYGALQAKGGTIGVLGCGIDQVYPAENRELYRNIEESGLLLSEYAPGIRPLPGLFPLRNRIIAGLSLGIVVVEAAERSGSLITATQALDASRDIFAVPGPITSPKSSGTLQLIKNGAKLVTCAEDILEEYRHCISFGPIAHSNEKSSQSILSEDERKLLGLLSSEPLTVDQLLVLSQFNFGHLHSVLLSLLLKKRIEQLPGSSYIMK
ncbi:DNA-processing protein DprA [Paenibacillus thalictri]|uniref:DNA-protecting protein DprA n=1 Tax=Paenibacillus thalictri TaxID=2527873 RepID=A0A4Q9DNR1_9BACL|nr:DNA-processing protein DprA [Paenibacillus thalictri]TBL77716.1 DNA-protecting protein DprA [Paenibacillus thalictri]